MRMRVLEVQIERWRIAYAGLGKAMLFAPELHAASAIRVEDTHLGLLDCISPEESGNA
jgi:hypothetical protein